jgi:hypothetical protein
MIEFTTIDAWYFFSGAVFGACVMALIILIKMISDN